MDISSGEIERASKFKVGQRVKAHIGGSSSQRHLPNEIEGVIHEIKGTACPGYVFTIKSESGYEFKPYYSNQLEIIEKQKVVTHTFTIPENSSDPMIMALNFLIKERDSLKEKNEKLESAIREFGGKYYDGYENAVDGKAFAVHIHDSVENLMSVLTEDKE